MKPSSFTLFARKIKGSGMNRIKLNREFNKRVDKSDFDRSEKREELAKKPSI
jgi:hypothetical protein